MVHATTSNNSPKASSNVLPSWTYSPTPLTSKSRLWPPETSRQRNGKGTVGSENTQSLVMEADRLTVASDISASHWGETVADDGSDEGCGGLLGLLSEEDRSEGDPRGEVVPLGATFVLVQSSAVLEAPNWEV